MYVWMCKKDKQKEAHLQTFIFMYHQCSEPPKKVHVKHFCKGIFYFLSLFLFNFKNNWATDKKVKC